MNFDINKFSVWSMVQKLLFIKVIEPEDMYHLHIPPKYWKLQKLGGDDSF